MSISTQMVAARGETVSRLQHRSGLFRGQTMARLPKPPLEKCSTISEVGTSNRRTLPERRYTSTSLTKRERRCCSTATRNPRRNGTETGQCAESTGLHYARAEDETSSSENETFEHAFADRRAPSTVCSSDSTRLSSKRTLSRSTRSCAASSTSRTSPLADLGDLNQYGPRSMTRIRTGALIPLSGRERRSHAPPSNVGADSAVPIRHPVPSRESTPGGE